MRFGQCFIPFVFSFYVYQVSCLHFSLNAGSKKCIQDESHKNVIVKGEYSVTNGDVNIAIRDLQKHTLYQKEGVNNGKFAFTTEKFEIFEMAQAEKLKPIEVELKRLEGLADEIVQVFVRMHDRSSTMRKVNESTHSRVLFFSILSMVILVGFACCQVVYLRRYFKSKKLIE